MNSRLSIWILVATFVGCGWPTAQANAPIRDSTFNFATPKFGGYQPLPKLVVSRDPNATTARLVLPAKLAAALKPAESPRVASGLPGTMVGLALSGSLIAGGLWLMRMPRAKNLLSVTMPLLGLALVGLVVHAQPARLETPRTTIETAKVRISGGAGADLELILPKRPAPAR